MRRLALCMLVAAALLPSTTRRPGSPSVAAPPPPAAVISPVAAAVRTFNLESILPAAAIEERDGALVHGGLSYAQGRPVVSASMLRMEPMGDFGPVRREGARLVYESTDGGLALVIRPTAAGMKEDLLVLTPAAMQAAFVWTLDLLPFLDARLDDDGSIGLYAKADAQILLASSSTGKRFGFLPAPIVRDARGRELRARFAFAPPVLSIIVMPDPEALYPIDVDPTLILTTDNDFRLQGNDESNARFESGSVKRDRTDAWHLPSWTAQSSFTNPRNYPASAVYNKFFYVLGGNDAVYFNDVQFASINDADGSLGAFTPTTSVPGTLRTQHAALACNGFMYYIGGSDSSSAPVDEVHYAPLNANGTISAGNWQATSSLPNGGRYLHAAVAWNGRIYVFGGVDATGITQTVLLAYINGDGSLSPWFPVSSLSSFQQDHGGFVWDGHLYAVGGFNGSFTVATAQYARILDDGSLSSWTTTTSLPSPSNALRAIAVNGYAYAIGGTPTGDQVRAAPILPGGGLGPWVSTTNCPARNSMGLGTYNGYVYMAGGNFGANSNGVYRARAQAGHTAAWNVAGTMPLGRVYHRSVAYNGFLYSVGGNSPGGTVDTVDFAPLNPDGTTGTWGGTTPMGLAKSNFGCDAHNGFLYAVGGLDSVGTFLTDVRFAAINANGTLGTWSTTTPLPVARSYMPAIAYNGRMYLLGGQTTECRYATINNNGSLGGWTLTNSMTIPRHFHGAVAYGGFMYVTGGDHLFVGTTNATESAAINSDGTLGTWAAGPPLPAQRQNHGLQANDGWLYTISGYFASADHPQVYAAPINSNGTMGAWQTTTSLPTGNQSHGSVLYNGFVYVVGGSQGAPVATVQFARVNTRGTIAAWNTTTPSPVLRQQHGAASDGTHAWLIGGGDSVGVMSTVHMSTLGADGSLGAWSATAPLLAARSAFGAAYYKSHLYAVAGYNGSASIASTEVGTVNPDGTIATWSTGPSLPTPRSSHAVAVWKGFLYSLGGQNLSGVLPDVAFSIINTDGTLAGWNGTTSLPIPVTAAAAVAHNDYLYVAGGNTTGGVPLADVFRAQINTNGTLGAWTRTAHLPDQRLAPSIAAHAGYLYLGGGVTASGAYDDSTFAAPVLASGALGAWMNLPSFATGRASSGMFMAAGNLYLTAGSTPGGTQTTDCQFARLRTPAPRATYSKLIDFGSDTTISSILTNGGGSNGIATAAYSTSSAAAFPPAFGASTTADITFGTPLAIGVTARYLLLRYTLDDSSAAVVSPDSTAQLRIDDITIISTSPPATPIGANQFQSDTTTVIPVGAGATATTIVVKSVVTDPDGDTVRLHIEIQDVNTPFFDAPTHTSAFVASGGTATITVTGLLPGEQYHWQAVTEDSTGAFSTGGAFKFGANDGLPVIPAPVDLFINQAPGTPTFMAQFESDGFTPIAEGGSTTSSTIVLQAHRADPDALSLVKLQIELRPFATAFTSPANPTIDSLIFFESPLDVPGFFHAFTISSLALGNYHWQMRCVDDNGATSAWTEFGGAGNTDFTVASSNNAPDVPTSMLQFENDGTTPIAIGGSAAAAAVRFEAALSDPDGGDNVKLQVELRPTGLAFTSPSVPLIDSIVFFETVLAPQGTIQIPITIPLDGSYHWQARVVDAAGAVSAWTPFGGNTDPSDPDIVLDLTNDPPTISSLTVGQFQSDGTTVIAEGGNATTVGVVLQAAPVDPNLHNVKLQVELRPFATAFTSPANPIIDSAVFFETTLSLSGSSLSIASGVLVLDSYHWQYRAVDSLGLASSWTEFTTPGNSDFTVVNNQSPAAALLAQFLADGTTPIAVGASSPSGTIVFKATVTDPEALTCKLQVEVQPVSVPFTGAFTNEGTFVASGAIATVTVSGLADDAYHWQARAVDAQGAIGAFLSFGGNPEAEADFRVDTTNNAPGTPTFAGQYVPPGDTGLAIGGSPFGRTVVIKAIAPEPEVGQIAYQVEIQPVGVGFTDTPTHASAFGPPGTFASITLTNLASGSYHWQIRAIDATAQASAWLPYGGNAESDADFIINATTAVPPNAPLSLQQKTSNGLAVIQTGATIAQAAVRLRAQVVHPRTEIVKLQVEVKPLSVPFDGAVNTESGFVDSGSFAEVQLFGFPNDDYHWQARTTDSKGTTSNWAPYGGNTEADIDFTVNVPFNTAPTLPGLSEQYAADGVTAIAVGASTSQTTLVFHAFLADIDGDSVRIEIEIKPLGVAFDGALSGLSPFLPNGTNAFLAVGSIPSGSFHWRVRATDANGASSVWVSYAANPETDADFIVRESDGVAPDIAANLLQLRDSGSTPIAIGAIAGPSEITFRSDATDIDLDPVRLEVEVRPSGQTFANVATHSGGFVPSGYLADAIIDRFPFDVGMKWQARVVDGNGRNGGWIEFGGNGSDADFVASFTVAGGGGKKKLCGLLGIELLLVMLVFAARRR